MSDHGGGGSSMSDRLSRPTSIFGLRLWVVLGVSAGAAFVLILFLLSLWITSSRRSTGKTRHRKPKSTPFASAANPSIPVVCREIQVDDRQQPDPARTNRVDPVPDSQQLLLTGEEEAPSSGYNRIQIEIGKDHRIFYPEKCSSSAHGSGEHSGGGGGACVPEVSHLGWGHWYTLRELEEATNGLADENVIGSGGYGIVYHGVLQDGSQIAVKNLLNNKGQAEREFKVEVEAIGRVRHKNLVRLLGYCVEGAHRMLVYEYVNNGNLEQWLHGDVGPRSPLTWEIRMKIILGTARGLAYLHEGLEPKVVHRDIKSSNILLDKQWNAKVSDFGLAKLLGSDSSYITTRVMGTFGYVAPEYASTGMLNERSDVYSFGILMMELLTGRNPVEYDRAPEEVNLVEWLKKMVSNRNAEGVLDPKLPELPNTRALKRALLVALRCVDSNAQKRPRMGHIIHMLEAEDASYKDDRRPSIVPVTELSLSVRNSPNNALIEKQAAVISSNLNARNKDMDRGD
uniref:non-specific serine/threonine protein kinase n=1 Tax=Kalanchoe fedtschenkoi TaxID=63787 RepID=A0A7N0TAN4_KALFE